MKANIKTLIIDQALTYLGGSENLYRYLINGFNENYYDVYERIKELCECGNFTDARILVHNVKGISGNIGANKLKDIAKKLEVAIQEDNIKYIELLNIFKLELDIVLNDIQLLISRDKIS